MKQIDELLIMNKLPVLITSLIVPILGTIMNSNYFMFN